MMWKVIILLALSSRIGLLEGYRYPEESESRQVKNLNGLWRFAEDFGDRGFAGKYFDKNFKKVSQHWLMPVPSSYNDIYADDTLRDQLGWVWYQKSFFLGKKWSGSRVFVYFGGVEHQAVVWNNGKQVGNHSGGHVPFHLELTRTINWDRENLLTVAVNNTLTPYSLPQGYTVIANGSGLYPSGTRLYSHNCDYFDYAGISRNVFLYSTPQTFTKDLVIDYVCSANETNCELKYEIILDKKYVESELNCTILMRDQSTEVKSAGCKNTINNPNMQIWWPNAPSPIDTVVKVQYKSFVDIYRTSIGLRYLDWDSNGLIVNGVRTYLKGFGMHEDSDIRGRGYDDAVALRDLSLLVWSGANVIRTSHYPYSEEFLNLCDLRGNLVILEVPACSLDSFNDKLYKEHERVTLEIIAKYKHHPSIIMWSLANEPNTKDNSSTEYFSNLYAAARSADPTRPITFVTSQSVEEEKAVGAMDFILVNRYNGWYRSGGRLDLIQPLVEQEVKAWRDKFNKPVIISEYGAGSIPGQHDLPTSMWSEDYHEALLKKHFSAFDSLREDGYLSGEMVWNFIDFRTPQEYIRPGFCMKGLFTRQRQPKSAARLIRQRYTSMEYK